jgi:hypothetical protein
MVKALGYVLSLAGLGIILFSKQLAVLSFLSKIPKISIYTVVAGVACILVGIIFMMDKSSSGKVKQVEEEVPIYEGEGKKRKIVGYKRAK